MEVDWNLKKLASFFKFFLCIVEKSLKTDYSIICSSSEKSLIFFLPGAITAVSCKKKKNNNNTTKGSLSNISAVWTKIQQNHRAVPL